MMTDFTDGIQYFMRGLRIIWQPKLRRFVYVPLFINCIVFVALIVAEIYGLEHLIHWLNGLLPSWLVWLSWLVSIILFIISLIIFTMIFTFVANLIATPFNGLLSLQVEKQLPGYRADVGGGLAVFLKEIPNMLFRSISMLVYYVPRALLYLVLFWIPGINLVAPVTWFAFNAWFMTLMYLDYPMDNHHISFKEMRTEMQEQFSLSLGFGCPVMLMTMLPIINFIVMPAAVAGATIMWHERFAGNYQE